jgi:hypothetical protein
MNNSKGKLFVILCSLVALLGIILLIPGCPNPEIPGVDEIKYEQEFRGEWIRMDTGDRWYINGNSITVTVNGITTKLSNSITLVKTSDNVVKATGAGNVKYTLFAARTANASFKTQVVFLDQLNQSASQNITARSSYERPMPLVRINNPCQPDLLKTVRPDEATGIIFVNNIIPGDPIEITLEDSEWDDIKVEITPAVAHVKTNHWGAKISR